MNMLCILWMFWLSGLLCENQDSVDEQRSPLTPFNSIINNIGGPFNNENKNDNQQFAAGDEDYNYDEYGRDWPRKFPQCGGKRQSPIDIITSQLETADFPPLQFVQYWSRPDQLILTDTGHTLQVSGKFPPGLEPRLTGGPIPESAVYVFAQLHFHWGRFNLEGSEHLINGKGFPLEVHFVHYKEEYGSPQNASLYDDGLVVVGAFYKISRNNNRPLDMILDGVQNLPPVGADGEPTNTEIMRQPLENILGEVFTNKYYNYPGSLTTPPCTENVNWIVSARHLQVTNKQMGTFRSTYLRNYRLTQPINDRTDLFVP